MQIFDKKIFDEREFSAKNFGAVKWTTELFSDYLWMLNIDPTGLSAVDQLIWQIIFQQIFISILAETYGIEEICSQIFIKNITFYHN